MLNKFVEYNGGMDNLFVRVSFFIEPESEIANSTAVVCVRMPLNNYSLS